MSVKRLTQFVIIATEATNAILDEITGRSGLDAAWDDCDEETQDAIRYEVGELVRQAMRQARTLPATEVPET